MKDQPFTAALRAQLKQIAGSDYCEMYWNIAQREDREVQARERLRRMYVERAAAVGMTLPGYCNRFGVKL